MANRQILRLAALRLAALRLAALIFGLAFAAMPASADPRPVVVELFTSQGCSSCPPADALLGELARRSDVLALGFHISYWDGLGWKDPPSSPGSTDRQKAYARHFNGGQVYTPQMIVDGTSEMIGSDRAAVAEALREARPETVVPIAFDADRHAVAIGSGLGNGEIVLVRLAQRRTTHVGAGENASRVLDDTNGVEALAVLGEWHGTALTFPIEIPAPGEGVAVLVQMPDGHILGAAALLAPG